MYNSTLALHPPADTVDPLEEERAMIARAAAGDPAAFRWIYDRHLQQVIRHVARVVGVASEVEDVVQDVFIQLHRSLPNFRGDSKLSTWLYRLTWNVSVTHIRRRRNVVELSALRALRLSHDEWNRLEARDRCKTLSAALDRLSQDAREAFLLHEVEGMKLREISELTGDSINTVAARVRRARTRLRDALESAEAINPSAESDHA